MTAEEKIEITLAVLFYAVQQSASGPTGISTQLDDCRRRAHATVAWLKAQGVDPEDIT